MMFRRFGYIQTRLLLEKQARLLLLEEELDRIDNLDNEDNRINTMSVQLRTSQYHTLIDKIEASFNEYC